MSSIVFEEPLASCKVKGIKTLESIIPG